MITFTNAKNRIGMTALVSTSLLVALPASADEGGVSFWLPGQFGSFSAVGSDPGWSLATIYYHTDTDADRSREFQVGGAVVGGLEAGGDLLIFAPSYAFSSPVAGGHLSLGLNGLFGRVEAEVDVTLTGPGGNSLTGGVKDEMENVGDLYPVATLKWNQGNHNYMAYAMGGVPVGEYSTDNLANIGTNHWALDIGGGYSYLDSTKGHEFSVTLGFTENWENSDTNYKNGVDGHVDWAASQFFSEQLHIGVVGYFYHQLSGDSGSGAVLGDFESRVSGVGPQVGYFFPVATEKWYVNFKGYYEFDSENRPEGWNAWLTLAVPL